MSDSRPLESPRVPVSWGELLDKITILEIKSARIAQPEKHANIQRELRQLVAARDHLLAESRKAAIGDLMLELRRVNEGLWDIEDEIREHEQHGDFGPAFVALARAVYTTNDRRAALKGEINRRLGSILVEEKSYAGAA